MKAMTYAEAIAHLQALTPELAPSAVSDGTPPARHKFELAHMRRLAAALGNPQDQVPSVLIAGTNGKGSTAATLASITNSAGYRTGLYTSPHLSRVNERIQRSHPVLPSEYGSAGSPGSEGPMRLDPIPDEDFAALYTRVDEAARQLVHAGDLPFVPSFFERLTAVAFLFFAELKLDLMILEVGLGGRLDATNIVEPLLSIVTDIALDHQDYLGNTIAEITAEKCGILRQNGILVTLPQLPEANHAIGLAATALGVRAINAAPFIPSPERASSAPIARRTLPATATAVSPHYHPIQGHPSVSLLEPDQPTLSIPGNRYTLTLEEEQVRTQLLVDSPLAGSHQQRNIALALTAALELRNTGSGVTQPTSNTRSYNLTNAAIEAGIRETRWPGRLELLPPNLLLDVAHNPAGAWTLRSAIAAMPETQPRTLLFSCLRDKDLAEMSRILFPLFDSSPDADPLRRQDHILLAPISSPRAAPVEDLLAAAHALNIPAHAAPHLAGALAQARQITPAGGLIIATGSVYLVGEVRQLALEQTA